MKKSSFQLQKQSPRTNSPNRAGKRVASSFQDSNNLAYWLLPLLSQSVRGQYFPPTSSLMMELYIIFGNHSTLRSQRAVGQARATHYSKGQNHLAGNKMNKVEKRTWTVRTALWDHKSNLVKREKKSSKKKKSLENNAQMCLYHQESDSLQACQISAAQKCTLYVQWFSTLLYAVLSSLTNLNCE